MSSTLFDSDGSTAVLSDDGRYRYRLGRRWGARPLALYVMLNPSTADAHVGDPTIRRCIGFAQTWGAGGIEVVNLFAYRTAYPSELVEAREQGIDVVGPENDRHIAEALAHPLVWWVVVAWGASPVAVRRSGYVADLVRQHGRRPMCLGVSKSGAPTHPLYVPGKRALVEWEARV